jgi:DNA-binding sugar fermentation-stimulating protein
MIGHISLAEKVDADFSHALRKALLRRVGACSRRVKTRPESMEQVEDAA